MRTRKTNKRILICGGGTAGHVYPAIAIIEEIRASYPEVELLYVGTAKGMESKFIPPLGINFRTIKAKGLTAAKGKLKKLAGTARFIFTNFLGFWSGLKVLLSFKPNIILGMGGYVCTPVLLAAMILRKRFMLHEQNYIPGRLNRFFSKYAQQVFISFEETKNYFPSASTVYSGNPVRKIIREYNNGKQDYQKWNLEKGRFTIVAFGGSLGADKLNHIMIDIYRYFKQSQDLQLVLITGNRFYEYFKQKKDEILDSQSKMILNILPYVEEMDQVYRISDLIISRAGANTIAELLITGIPAILIPYPYAVQNHQYFNAQFLADRGKAILIPEKDLSSDLLIDNIRGLIEHNREHYKQWVSRPARIQKMDSHKVIVESLVNS